MNGSQSEDMLTFLLHHADSPSVGPRLGRLICRGRGRGRDPIQTPSYLATTSRGVVPHLTQDVVQKHTSISALYFGLEDFIEKSIRNAPILSASHEQGHESPLRDFTSLPARCLSVLGSRRIPNVPSAQPNGSASIGITTSVGFSHLLVEDYTYAARLLKPDVVVGIADLVAAEKSSKKRLEKMADRTHAWLRDALNSTDDEDIADSTLFASIPPIEPEMQSFYLSDLGDEYRDRISGVCLYNPHSTAAIPKSLYTAPTLCLTEPTTPNDILHAISLGVDLITVPFTTSASEAGIALTFSLHDSPPTTAANDDDDNNNSSSTPTNSLPLPLGIDMWSPNHATSITPLSPGCTCYTCTRHHAAYIQHLLQAKEMLAWTLLQIHNFHILDLFFSQIRDSIAKNTFEADAQSFNQRYEPDLPVQTGQGPRIRGYQMQSVGGGESKKNAKAYGRLDEQARKVEEAKEERAVAADEDSKALEEHGFAEKLDPKP